MFTKLVGSSAKTVAYAQIRRHGVIWGRWY